VTIPPNRAEAPAVSQAADEVGRALAAGRPDLALSAAVHWAMAAPATLKARILIAGLCHSLGALPTAERQARMAAALDPSIARPLDALAVIAADEERIEDAVRFGLAALFRAPADPSLIANLGSVLRAAGRTDGAIRLLERALALLPSPDLPAARDAAYNLANAHSAGAPGRALALFVRVCAADPAHHRALGNLGLILTRFGWAGAGRRALERCAALSPDYATGVLNLGNCHREVRDFETAAALYDRARALDPRSEAALVNRFDVALHGADPATRAALLPAILSHVQTALAEGRAGSVSPMTLLHLPVPPDLRRRQANLLARETIAAVARRPVRPIAAGGPLTVGYLSGDYRDHAIGHLMAGLFAAHDRRRVRVVALSTGPNDGSTYRRRYETDADRFVDAALLSDRDLIAAIEAEPVDILVDVSGHTRFDRLPVVAARPAPVVVHFLGFPGPIGSGLADWMIADPILAKEAPNLPNPLAILPECYQVNDRQQRIGGAGTRADHGLPADAVVIAGLVAPAKLGPETLSLWSRTVSAIPNAVLWLLSPGPAGEDRLRVALSDHGLDPRRVVFAPRAAKPEHLARQRHADLALDSLIYGGHTTTSDALWAGLPVLTLEGEGFAARVAASLLTAVGLSDLIVGDETRFVETARRIGGDIEARQEIKARLAANRLSWPLFDTERFARHLEDAYEAMAARTRRGDPPATFHIPARPAR